LEFPPGIADAMRTASYKLLETEVNGRRSIPAEQRSGGSGRATFPPGLRIYCAARHSFLFALHRLFHRSLYSGFRHHLKMTKFTGNRRDGLESISQRAELKFIVAGIN
jgi:hypothetical protein